MELTSIRINVYYSIFPIILRPHISIRPSATFPMRLVEQYARYARRETFAFSTMLPSANAPLPVLEASVDARSSHAGDRLLDLEHLGELGFFVVFHNCPVVFNAVCTIWHYMQRHGITAL
jgi:hypothetical protein